MEALAVIASIRAGKTDAFETIIEQYQYQILRYLYRLTGDYAVAQDLAQDTFINAYKSILKTDSELRLKPWLYRIATNNALQYHRRRKLVSLIPFESLWKSVPGDSENNHATRDSDIAIQDTLRKIPSDKRACLVLHYVEGFKYREIAETLGISEEAVRKRVARGKQLFRQLYKEEER